jgi:hypothetical protein
VRAHSLNIFRFRANFEDVPLAWCWCPSSGTFELTVKPDGYFTLQNAGSGRANASKFHGIRELRLTLTPQLQPGVAALTPAFSRFNGFSKRYGKPLKRLRFLHPTIHRAEAAVLM